MTSAKRAPAASRSPRKRLAAWSVGYPWVMQNMVSASAPMVAAVSPRTRIRLQRSAQANSAGRRHPGRRSEEPARRGGDGADGRERRHGERPRAVGTARVGQHPQPAAQAHPEHLRPVQRPAEGERQHHRARGAQPRHPLRLHRLQQERAAQVARDLLADGIEATHRGRLPARATATSQCSYECRCTFCRSSRDRAIPRKRWTASDACRGLRVPRLCVVWRPRLKPGSPKDP